MMIWLLPALAGGLMLSSATALPATALPVTAAILSGSRPQTRQIPSTSPPSPKTSQAARLALARHLSAIGARVYTAYWCPHCQAQKDMFGSAALASLNVIECADDGPNSRWELCKAKRITRLPTWEIHGRMEAGVQSLEQLAAWSGYRGPRTF